MKGAKVLTFTNSTGMWEVYPTKSYLANGHPLKFLGITYLAGKLKFFFFLRVHWLSEKSYRILFLPLVVGETSKISLEIFIPNQIGEKISEAMLTCPWFFSNGWQKKTP